MSEFLLRKIDVLIGDEGGIFSAAAFLMKKRGGYKAGSGIPNLPG